MKYLKVKWIHDNPNYPVVIISEFEDDGWETRKVECFADGRRGIAPPDDDRLGTGLSIEPIPSIEEIGLDPQFEPEWFSQEEFEEFWNNRKSADE